MTYFDDYYDERDNWVHIDDIPDLDYARRKMNHLIDILYGKSKMEDFEDTLEEICSVLDMSLPNKDLLIKKA